MAIMKYRRGWPGFARDYYAWVDDWINPLSATWTWNGQWVDTSKYDIVPKPDYRKSLAEEKQREIDRLDKERKRLEAELKELKKD